MRCFSALRSAFPSPSLGKAIITYSVAFRDTRYQQYPPHFSLFWSNPEQESPPLSLSRYTALADSHPSSSKEVPQSKNGHLSFSSHLAPSQGGRKFRTVHCGMNSKETGVQKKKTEVGELRQQKETPLGVKREKCLLYHKLEAVVREREGKNTTRSLRHELNGNPTA